MENMPAVTEYKGNPVLAIPYGQKDKPFMFGLRKAETILEYRTAIECFARYYQAKAEYDMRMVPKSYFDKFSLSGAMIDGVTLQDGFYKKTRKGEKFIEAPLISLPLGYGEFTFGVGKALAVAKYIEEIREFVDKHSETTEDDNFTEAATYFDEKAAA